MEEELSFTLRCENLLISRPKRTIPHSSGPSWSSQNRMLLADRFTGAIDFCQSKKSISEYGKQVSKQPIGLEVKKAGPQE